MLELFVGQVQLALQVSQLGFELVDLLLVLVLAVFFILVRAVVVDLFPLPDSFLLSVFTVRVRDVLLVAALGLLGILVFVH